MQERLAKVVGGRNTSPSARSTPALASETSSPSQAPASPRSSFESRLLEQTVSSPEQPNLGEPESLLVADVERTGKKNDDELRNPPNTSDYVKVVDPLISSSVATQPEALSEHQPKPNKSLAEPSPAEYDHEDVSQLIRALPAGYESRKLTHEETNQYIEQIDALQAKLSYLTQEAANEARLVANTTENGSLEQQIAFKDEKIAHLLQEGTGLAQNELKLRATVKKLSAKAIEDEKYITQLKRRIAETGKASKLLSDKLETLEEISRGQIEQRTLFGALERELQQLRGDVSSRNDRIAKLREQMAQHKSAGATEEAEKWRHLVEAERKKLADVQEELSEARIEKELVEDRSRAQIRDLHTKLDHEIETGKAMELDLKGEMQV